MSLGGVRVNRDSNHMSGTFGFLPGPCLARELVFLITVSALRGKYRVLVGSITAPFRANPSKSFR
jgi:hypothetical protein